MRRMGPTGASVTAALASDFAADLGPGLVPSLVSGFPADLTEIPDHSEYGRGGERAAAAVIASVSRGHSEPRAPETGATMKPSAANPTAHATAHATANPTYARNFTI